MFQLILLLVHKKRVSTESRTYAFAAHSTQGSISHFFPENQSFF
jgi:hypothetical protein